MKHLPAKTIITCLIFIIPGLCVVIFEAIKQHYYPDWRAINTASWILLKLALAFMVIAIGVNRLRR